MSYTKKNPFQSVKILHEQCTRNTRKCMYNSGSCVLGIGHRTINAQCTSLCRMSTDINQCPMLQFLPLDHENQPRSGEERGRSGAAILSYTGVYDGHRWASLYFQQCFKFILQDKQETVDDLPSLWKVFFVVCKVDIFYAGLTLLGHDLASLIGPLALNGIVAYVITYNADTEVIIIHQIKGTIHGPPK